MKSIPDGEKKKQEFVCPEEPEIAESAAARRIKALGDDESFAESSVPTRRVGRLEEFWYRHRWHAGISIFLIILAAILLIQFVTRDRPDAYILYAGPGAFTGNRFESFESALEEVLEDYNGDGKKHVSMSDCTYLSQAQLDARQGLKIDIVNNNSAYQRFTVEISAGQRFFCMLDPALYEDVASQDGFLPISEIFGDEIPSCAYGEYGIRLGDTMFYKYFGDIHFIPEDTVLSVRVLPAGTDEDNGKALENQRRHIELLRAIAEYKPE